jgi:SAM-dependent methyltransferase
MTRAERLLARRSAVLAPGIGNAYAGNGLPGGSKRG